MKKDEAEKLVRDLNESVETQKSKFVGKALVANASRPTLMSFRSGDGVSGGLSSPPIGGGGAGASAAAAAGGGMASGSGASGSGASGSGASTWSLTSILSGASEMMGGGAGRKRARTDE